MTAKSLSNLIILLFTAAFASAATRLVPDQYPNIQAAIDDCNDGDTVIVAPGTYTGVGNYDIDFKGKAITVRSTDPNNPNIVAATIIDCNAARDEYHRAFYFHSEEDTNSIVAGFTITNARREGAIYCSQSGPTIYGCVITGNSSRGVYCKSGSPVIANCTISDCSQHRWSAAFFSESNATVVNCTIANNPGTGLCCGPGSVTVTDCTIAENGDSGIRCWDGAPVITNCNISYNRAREGAGVHCGEDSKPVFNDCLFGDNTATDNGGAVYCDHNAAPLMVNCRMVRNSAGYGAGIYADDGSGPALANCVLTGNTAKMGAGVANSGAALTLANCLMTDNTATTRGGAISNWKGSATLTNCIFAGNSAGDYGGAIYNTSELTLTSSTLTGNITATQGGALFSAGSTANVTNCILWGNQADDGHEIQWAGSSELSVTYSNIQGGWPGTGNIDADPCFVLDTDYHLSPNSPCVDAGTNSPDANLPTTDFDGLARVVDGSANGNALVDMGAYEYDPHGPRIALSASAFSLTCVAGEPAPPAQVLAVANCGTDTLHWETIHDADWLKVSPESGTSRSSPSYVGLSVDHSSLPIGSYACTLLISDSNALDSPKAVDVTLIVLGRTVHVPDDMPTIQDAIDYAMEGGTVVVALGVYTGPGNRDLEFYGKAITVTSTNPHNPDIVAETVIDCQATASYPHRAFRFVSGEGPNSVVTGLTLTNGYAPGEGKYQDWYYGGAIYCEGSSPTISYCLITGNTAGRSNHSAGGAIFCSNSHATLSHCIITDNVVDTYSPYYSYYCGGGGIACYYDSNVAIAHCIIADNSAGSASGGGIRANDDSNVTISDSIIWSNTASDGAQITLAYRSNLTISYSDVQDGVAGVFLYHADEPNWGPGNIDVDPRFVDPNARDYHLALDSLCINAGDPTFIPSEGQRDIDGQERVINGRLDIGPDEVDYEGPLIGINPAKCLFDANEGGPNPQPQGFSVFSSGPGTVNWQIDYDCNWLDVSPTAGTSTGESDEVTLTVDVNCMKLGLYYTTVVISDPDVANSPQLFEVVLHIRGMTVRVPAEYPTIQAAIDDVLEGGTVLVADGIYSGEGNHDIEFRGKAITLRSQNGPGNCIIDCSDPERWYDHRGFYFHSGEDSNSVLSGFTITNGWVYGACGYASGGGAIMCSSSSPTITNCIITNNTCTTACIVGGSSGGGVCLLESRATITNCIITGNMAYGGAGGIHCYDSSPIITNCTICDNFGSGIWGVPYYGEPYHPIIANCILWGNSLEQMVVDPNTTVVTFSNVQGGWPGLGNISEDPLFVDHGYWDPNGTTYATYDDFWVNGDYHLKSNGWRWDAQRKDWTWDDVTSRCIDAGNPDWPLGNEPLSIYADPNNEWGQNLRINMGAYGGTAEASMPPYGWAIRSDYNNDGIVNFTDFACWSIYHGYILPEPPDDSSPSPTLNSADLALLADRWLEQTTWFATLPPPTAAWNPDPFDGATGVRTTPVLSWQPGFGAVSHDVYFGTTNPPAFQRNQTETTFNPGALNEYTAYSWRIDEVNSHATTPGILWSFTTTHGGGTR